jgi:hypothetical protein
MPRKSVDKQEDNNINLQNIRVYNKPRTNLKSPRFFFAEILINENRPPLGPLLRKEGMKGVVWRIK